jgi:periplasmic protein CpxP/Spy
MNRISRCVSKWRGLLLVGILAAGGGLLHAQSDAAPAPGPGGPGHRGGPERRLEMLTRVLSLTPDQQTQVKALLTEQRTKMEAMRKATPAAETETAGGPANRAQFEALRTDTDTKINALLTDEQKTKFAALQAEHRPPHGGGPEGAPPAPPVN